MVCGVVLAAAGLRIGGLWKSRGWPAAAGLSGAAEAGVMIEGYDRQGIKKEGKDCWDY